METGGKCIMWHHIILQSTMLIVCHATHTAGLQEEDPP